MNALFDALRRNADLTEKAIEFMSDPEQIEEARADIDLWRNAAAAIKQLEVDRDRAVAALEQIEDVVSKARRPL